jgi:hypothetical protein
MNIQEVENIRKAFLSKAPERYYYHQPNMTHRGLKYAGIFLFDGASDSSKKVASFSVKAHDSESMMITIGIGWNTFEFLENPTLCLEIIKRFIPTFTEQLTNS